MMIQAKLARLYIDLIEHYDYGYAEDMHELINEKVRWVITKLCADPTFQVEERSEVSLMGGILYCIFEENQLLVRNGGQTKNEFFEWIDVTRPTVIKWAKLVEAFGFENTDFSIDGLNPGVRVFIDKDSKFDLDSLDWDSLSEEDLASSEIKKMLEDKLFGAMDATEAVDLYEILLNQPPTDSGFNTFIKLADKEIKSLAKPVKREIAQAENEPEFNLWYHWPARPYMTAMSQLMYIYHLYGEDFKALEISKTLLKLSPVDNLGVRDFALPLAIAVNDDRFAKEILDNYAEDMVSGMQFNRALFYYKIGDSRAEATAVSAIKSNRHIAQYLFGSKQLPQDPSQLPVSFAIGDEDEAILYAYSSKFAWTGTKGAIEFLKSAKKYVGKAEKTGKVVPFGK